MLPDFPIIKARLFENHLRDVRKKIDAEMPVASRIKAVCAHEGDGFSYERTDGKIETQKYRLVSKQMAFSTRLSFDETLTEMRQQMKSVVTEMAEVLEKALFKELERVTSEVGNVVDGKGKPFSLELYLDALEKVDIEFDHFGIPELPTFVIHPAMEATMRAEFNRFKTNSVLREQAEQIMIQKRKDYLDRTSRRRLVD